MHNEPYEPSPCDNHCEVDRTLGYCLSCCRTINEIRNWLKVSNEERIQIKELVKIRKSSIKGD